MEKSHHIIELQSIRGIAAAAVMVGHAMVYYDTPMWFHRLAILSNGRAAVVIFFVLSGYVLTRSLSKSAFDRAAVLRFYVQRLFRIYPAVWVASAMGLGYLFLLHWQIPVQHEGDLIRSQFRTDRFDTLHIVASIAGMTTFILPQLWTIFVELVASIALPGIAFIALRRPGWFPVLVGAAFSVSVLFPNTYYHTTMYFMDFVVGAGLAIPGVAETIFFRAPARHMVAACLFGLAMTQEIGTDYWNPWVHLGETWFAYNIIGTLIGAERRVAILKSPVLILLGDISFSLYLLHYVILCTLAKAFVLLPAMNISLLNVLLTLATCVVSLPLAWLSFTYIEKPSIALGRKLIDRQPVKRLNLAAVFQDALREKTVVR